ncbi:hypothetical protein [Nocardia sp. NBC_01388]|uniref:hypothetical protein n=1 Tax=Nocardia sp. NBC_01388 TaxID=2903596 RepID=UPI00325077D3
MITNHPRAALISAAAAMAAAMLLLPTLGRAEFGAAALLLIWGIGYGGIPVILQTCFARVVPDHAEVSSVLFTASFQATFSLSALAGCLLLDRTSPSAVLSCGGITALLVLGICLSRRASANS